MLTRYVSWLIPPKPPPTNLGFKLLFLPTGWVKFSMEINCNNL